jgi:catechol 2,3-dioxygenase-like lactoylglutathione lyase family enzyme
MMKAIACYLASLLALASAGTSDFPRSAHWVIRTSDLEKTLNFTSSVLGMRVLRHEENDKPCPITCNGDSPTAWSKTMVGYATEDQAYALEVR